MNSRITIFILSFFIGLTAQSQSNTIEIKPTFQKSAGPSLSEVIDFNITFKDISFVGISAFHFDADYKDIEYRVRHGKQWSSWQSFSPQHELIARTRTAYEGQFITSPFSAIQFMTSDLLETELTVRLFIGKRKKENDIQSQKSILCEQLDMCERPCWCATCPIDNTPELTTPTHIIVHHSAGSNEPNLNYSEVVKYIWDLHVNTNGWDDIGYNWLIDPDGVLYEGRPDGYQGAHFSCINENTVGVCLLGDFTSISPEEEAVNTLVNLVAFEATDHDIDVLSESYHETGDFILANVAGHRDSSGSDHSCSDTACPGDTFYPMLESVRTKVAALDCYQDYISSTSSLDKNLWSIYPNPFQSTLKIEYKDNSQKTVEILDPNGQKCSTVHTNYSFDLSHLASGVYFIVCDGQIIEKVVKE